MAWFPTLLPDRRSQLAAKKRYREAKRWLCTPRVLTAAAFIALTTVCILLLSVGDDAVEIPPASRAPPANYWEARSVTTLPPNSYPPPSDVQDFIKSAVRYIVRANEVTKDGRFAYLYTLRSDGTIYLSRNYNTLRHSGTVYALADACPPGDDRPTYCKGADVAVKRAADWIAGTAAPMGASDALGLWSSLAVESPRRYRERKGRGNPSVVRAGGIGLGLIALIQGRAAGSAHIDAMLLRDVARGATDVMQQADGSMAGYYYKKSGLDTEKKNPFYNGEAALGLLYLYGANGNVTLRHSAERTLVAMAKKGDKPHVKTTCDHWYLISTGKLLRDVRYDVESRATEEGRVRRATLKRHAKRGLRACVARNTKYLPKKSMRGNGLGSSVEAQLNVLPLLLEREEITEPSITTHEAKHVWCLVKRTLGAMMSLQFHDGGESSGNVLDGGVSGVGEFKSIERRGRQLVRVRMALDGRFQIDTTQHTLSGMLAYVRVASHPSFADIVCDHELPLVEPRGLLNVIRDS